MLKLSLSDFVYPFVHFLRSALTFVVYSQTIHKELDRGKSFDFIMLSNGCLDSGIDLSNDNTVIFQKLWEFLILGDHGFTMSTPGGIKLDHHIFVGLDSLIEAAGSQVHDWRTNYCNEQ